MELNRDEIIIAMACCGYTLRHLCEEKKQEEIEMDSQVQGISSVLHKLYHMRDNTECNSILVQ
jgi:hypothetical protein